MFDKRDIHIHVPDGATPKDGPSAGAAMTTAFVLVLFQNYVMGTLQTNQNNLMAMALFIVVFGFGMRYLKKKTRVFKVD
jgi:hypothetical protein